MDVSRWVIRVSLLLGFYALGSAGLALSRGPSLPGLGIVLPVAAMGVALILPKRTVPALRRLAETYASGPIRFLCALAMLWVLTVATIAGTAHVWLSLPVMIGFMFAFIFPGFAFRGVKGPEPDDIDRGPFDGVALGEDLRQGPVYRRVLFLLAVVLFFVGLYAVLFGPQTVPGSDWAAISGWVAVIVAGLVTISYVRLALRQMPEPLPRHRLPPLMFWIVVIFGIAIASNRGILLTIIPSVAASHWGEEIEQPVTIVQMRGRSNGCSQGEIKVQWEGRSQTVCVGTAEFYERLSVGEELTLIGPATWFGQRVQQLRYRVTMHSQAGGVP